MNFMKYSYFYRLAHNFSGKCKQNIGNVFISQSSQLKASIYIPLRGECVFLWLVTIHLLRALAFLLRLIKGHLSRDQFVVVVAVAPGTCQTMLIFFTNIFLLEINFFSFLYQTYTDYIHCICS